MSTVIALLIVVALLAWLAVLAAAAIITGGNRQPETPIRTTDDPDAVWQAQARDGQQ